jgi:N-acetylmuramoyl-L-alanine amidase
VNRPLFLFGLIFLLLGVSGAGPLAAATRAYESVRLFGTDYVDARQLGQRFGLTAHWLQTGKKLRLKSRWTTIDFAVDRLEITLNGLRLFLGEPVIARANSLWLGRSDAEALLGPILAPTVAKPVPALRTIVIDPGHGGNDPGNRNLRLGLTEKQLTLDVALRLERLLEAQGYRVVLTRTGDRRVELDERTALARRVGADLFIGIHFNAFPQPHINGTETFVMTPRYQPSSPQAERDPKLIATRHPSNRFDPWNALLGYQMHRQLVEHLKLADRGLKRFRYRVLCTVECPAVLVEAGFLSNDGDGRKIADAAFRQKIAAAIAAGVKANAATLARARAAKPAP